MFFLWLLGCGAQDWSRLSTLDQPEFSIWAHAIHAGDVVLFWGGLSPEAGHDSVDTAGAWDIASAEWIEVEPSGGGPMARSTLVWTGSEVIAWGLAESADDPEAAPTGRVWDRASGQWRPVTAEGAPDGATQVTAVWTGEEMIVWGGLRSDGCIATRSSAYDPTADEWRPLATEGAPPLRLGHGAVWTGAEMVVAGGALPPNDEPCRMNGGSAEVPDWELQPVEDAWGYDPLADSWRQIAANGVSTGAYSTWTGEQAVFWGGGSGSAWNPADDAWSPVAAVSLSNALAWWTDEGIYRWDRQDLRLIDPWNGENVRLGAPAYEHHAGAWTGDELVAWGGFEALRGEFQQSPGWIFTP